jgi:hypothetical protein
VEGNGAPLCALAGAGGASSILAQGRRLIGEQAAGNCVRQVRLGALPAQVLRLAIHSANVPGPRPHPRKVAGGAIASTLALTIALRARWGEVRAKARAFAAQAAAPGDGWLLALAFAQLKVTLRDARAPCACFRRDRKDGAAGGAGATARIERCKICQALLRDATWRRACDAHLHGRCGDAAERVCRMHQKANAVADRARKAALAAVAREGLLHWGVSGPLPRDCTGIAVLGVPDGEDDARPVFRFVIGAAAPRTEVEEHVVAVAGADDGRGGRAGQDAGAEGRRAQGPGRSKGRSGESAFFRLAPKVRAWLRRKEQERKRKPQASTPEQLAA